MATPRKSTLTWPFAHLHGEWSLQPADDLALARVGHTAVVLGEWAILYGGIQPDQANRERELSCIHTRTCRWFRLPCTGTAPSGRAWHSAAGLDGDRMLLFGGSNGRKLFGDLHELTVDFSDGIEPTGAAWSKPATTGETPPSRMGHTSAIVPGGRLWMFGGFTKASANKGYAGELFELDVATMDWHRLDPRQDDGGPPIPGRLGASGFMHGDSFVVFGGSINGKAVNELLTISTDARVALRPVQAAGAAAVTPRHSAAVALSADRRVALLYGGCECDKETGTNRVLGDLLLLELATFTWTVLKPAKGVPSLPGLRFKHTLCAVDAGGGGSQAAVLLYGGSDGVNAAASSTEADSQLWRLRLTLPDPPAAAAAATAGGDGGGAGAAAAKGAASNGGGAAAESKAGGGPPSEQKKLNFEGDTEDEDGTVATASAAPPGVDRRSSGSKAAALFATAPSRPPAAQTQAPPPVPSPAEQQLLESRHDGGGSDGSGARSSSAGSRRGPAGGGAPGNGGGRGGGRMSIDMRMPSGATTSSRSPSSRGPSPDPVVARAAAARAAIGAQQLEQQLAEEAQREAAALMAAAAAAAEAEVEAEVEAEAEAEAEARAELARQRARVEAESQEERARARAKAEAEAAAEAARKQRARGSVNSQQAMSCRSLPAGVAPVIAEMQQRLSVTLPIPTPRGARIGDDEAPAAAANSTSTATAAAASTAASTATATSTRQRAMEKQQERNEGEPRRGTGTEFHPGVQAVAEPFRKSEADEAAPHGWAKRPPRDEDGRTPSGFSPGVRLKGWRLLSA